MAKEYFTEGTGNQQVLHESPTEKIPVYDNEADMNDDIANLSDGQIVATVDSGSELSQPVNTVESGNLHAVTSNAVAGALSQLTDIVNDKIPWAMDKTNSASTCDISNLPQGVYLIFATDLYHNWDAYYIGVLQKYTTSGRRLTTISNRTLTLTVSGDTLGCTSGYYIWQIKMLRIGY